MLKNIFKTKCLVFDLISLNLRQNVLFFVMDLFLQAPRKKQNNEFSKK